MMPQSTPNPAPPCVRRRRARRLILGVLLVAGAALYLGRAYLLAPAARFLDVSEPPHAVDYVMVLGGGNDTRPFVAAALYEAGLAKGVLMAGFSPNEEVDDILGLPQEEVLRKILNHRGVPSQDIHILDGTSASTRDEANALARFLEQHPGSTVGVVTSDYHTRRTRLLFRRALGNRANQVCFLAAPTDGFSASDWWRHEMGCHHYLDEFIKLIFYELGY